MSSTSKKSTKSKDPKATKTAAAAKAGTKPKPSTASTKAPAKGKPKATPVEPKATPTEAAVTTAEATPPEVAATAPETTAPGTPGVAAEGQSKRDKLTDLDVPTLQSMYLDVVGRPTGSDNKAYLIWKIREARKGRIPVGPRQSTRREGVTFKTLPLRMESDLVDKLDEVWRKRGLRSRMDLFRRSLQTYLTGVGETDVAAMLTPGA